MKPLNINNVSFENEVLHSALLTIVDFWAPWCGPCKTFGPVLDQAASRFDGQVKVTKLNVDENPDTARRYGVKSIPTILFFRNGEVVDRINGAVSGDQFEDRINRLLSVSKAA